MKASLALEVFGIRDRQAIKDFDGFCRRCGILNDSDAPPMMPWVAEVIGTEFGPKLRFLPSKRDYSKANSRASRGVMEHFVVEEDRLYRVGERIAWRRSQEYWAAVTPDGNVVQLSDEVAKEWLSEL